MLQALFATPAEKSWIEEVSWIPEQNRDYIDRILRNSGGFLYDFWEPERK